MDALVPGLAEHLHPAYRARLEGTAHGILQAVHAPSRAFEFRKLATLFATQLAPTQVFLRLPIEPVFCSPAHLTRFGLP
jgi:hypothetical protein